MDHHTRILIAEKLYTVAAAVQDIADILTPGSDEESAPGTHPTPIFNLNINLGNNDEDDDFDEDDDDYWDDDYDDEEEEAPVSVFARTPVFSVFSARS